MRRLMQTTIALPSSAAIRSSKCFTRSWATNKPLVGADQRLDAGPFSLEAFLLACRFVLGEVLDFGVDLGFLGFIEFDTHEPALVIDRHGRPVLDSAGDVVDVNVVAEYGRRVDIIGLDGRSGEAHEG